MKNSCSVEKSYSKDSQFSRPQLVFLFAVLFFFIFSPRLNLGVMFHFGYVSVVVLSMSIIIGGRFDLSFFRTLLPVVLFFVVVAVYHLVLASIYGNNSIYFISICISAVVSISFGWLLSYYLVTHGYSFLDLLDCCIKLCAFVIFFNSLVILVEFFAPPIKHYLELLHFSQVTNINYLTHPFRLRGLAAAGGAALSVVNALGVILFYFLVKTNKINGSIALLCSLVIVTSNIFVGRTGLIFSLIFFVALVTTLVAGGVRYVFLGYIRTVPLVILVALFLSVFFVSQYDFSLPAFIWAFEWVDGLRHGRLNTSSSDDLLGMIFLPNDLLHLLFGVGFFEGEGQMYPRTDSGYLKTLLSIGILLSLAFYSFILYLFFQLAKVSKVYFWLVLPVIGFMLIVEIKEPFIYQNYSSRVIFMLSGVALFVLGRRDKC